MIGQFQRCKPIISNPEIDINETIRALVEPRGYIQTEDVDIDLLFLVDNSDAVDDRSTLVSRGTVKKWKIE